MNLKSNNAYVVDTSVLMDMPDIFFKLDNTVVVPSAVIKEIDGLKKSGDEVKAKAARRAARILDSLSNRQNSSPGMNRTDMPTVIISRDYTFIDELDSIADNRIVGTAIKLKKTAHHEVILLSKDRNMRNVARAHDIHVLADPFSFAEANSCGKIVDHEKGGQTLKRDSHIDRQYITEIRKLQNPSLYRRKAQLRMLYKTVVGMFYVFIGLTILGLYAIGTGLNGTFWDVTKVFGYMGIISLTIWMAYRISR